jgi:nucleotide-binding universal stress UspA family protein
VVATWRAAAYPDGCNEQEPTPTTVKTSVGVLVGEVPPMHQFTNVLVFSQGESPSPSAVQRLVGLLQKNGATVRLMAVIEPFPWYTRLLLPASVELQRLQVESSDARLSSLAAALKQKGVKITTKVAIGRAPLELIREVLRSGHDLFVKVAEPAQGNVFGSTDMRLLRNCPCPVLLLHPAMQDRRFQRILVAVDPPPAPDVLDELHLRQEASSEEQALNVKLMEFAMGLAEIDEGELHIVHAWTAPGEDLLRVEGRLPRHEVDEYVASLREGARKAVEQLLAECPPTSGSQHVHLIKGRPADVIAEMAKAHDVDLIVMGTVVRTGIPGLLIGNTAETVFHQVGCSVLAIKPNGFVSPVADVD